MHNFVVSSNSFNVIQDWLIDNGTGYLWVAGAHFNEGKLFNTVAVKDEDFAVRFKLVWAEYIIK